jgi:hypothetical protein
MGYCCAGFWFGVEGEGTVPHELVRKATANPIRGTWRYGVSNFTGKVCIFPSFFVVLRELTAYNKGIIY